MHYALLIEDALSFIEFFFNTYGMEKHQTDCIPSAKMSMVIEIDHRNFMEIYVHLRDIISLVLSTIGTLQLALGSCLCLTEIDIIFF